MLEIKNLSFSYDGITKILDNINMTLPDNKIVSILGESGVGKSTIFNLIAGMLKYEEGGIYLDNELVDLKGKVSYMLQKDMLFDHKTVLDNVALPLIIRKIPKKQAREEALNLLKEFKLDKWAKSYPYELSGGMRQRVALLRTYMFKRNIILLDEAFNAIDTITKAEVYDWYLEVSKKLEISTLLITHYIDEAILLSDKIYVLKGRPAKVVLELDVHFPKPRKFAQTLDTSFLEYKKTIYDVLGK